ncbi:uncharacterized protein [Rutidosis leptorrhynchoides]|uniref:uncharacterized protein n=1 Tax=Rutidosis leptorrhynchoides TaxID=125765 RepID=UPI003A99956E
MAEKEIEFFSSDVDMPPLPPVINIINFDNYRFNKSNSFNNWSSSSSSSLHEITEVEEDEQDDAHGFKLMSCIREEDFDSDLFSYDFTRNVSDVHDVVYVVTWRGTDELANASMDALVWTLGNDLNESSIVYLVHIFPEMRCIPTLLGNLPLIHASPEQKECYMNHERSKRSEYLQKFLSVCSSSKVKVETVLIESDTEAKAILDLIPILNIRKLVLGTTKSNLKKLRKKGGRGTLDQIVHNVPPYCEVKVICEGKEVSLQDHLNNEPTSPLSTTTSFNSSFSKKSSNSNLKALIVQQDNINGFVGCISCFKI